MYVHKYTEQKRAQEAAGPHCQSQFGRADGAERFVCCGLAIRGISKATVFVQSLLCLIKLTVAIQTRR